MKTWTRAAWMTVSLAAGCADAGDTSQASKSTRSAEAALTASAPEPVRVAVYWGAVAGGGNGSKTEWSGNVGVEGGTFAGPANHALEADDAVTGRPNAVAFRSVTTSDTDGFVVQVSGKTPRLTISGRNLATTVVDVASLGCGPTRIRRTDSVLGAALLVQKACKAEVAPPSANIEVVWGRKPGAKSTPVAWSWRLQGVQGGIAEAVRIGTESSDRATLRTGELTASGATADDLDGVRLRLAAKSWAEASATSLCATVNGQPSACWSVSELLCRSEETDVGAAAGYRITGGCGNTRGATQAFAGESAPTWYPDPDWFADPANYPDPDWYPNPDFYPDPTWYPDPDWYPDPTWYPNPDFCDVASADLGASWTAGQDW